MSLWVKDPSNDPLHICNAGYATHITEYYNTTSSAILQHNDTLPVHATVIFEYTDAEGK